MKVLAITILAVALISASPAQSLLTNLLGAISNGINSAINGVNSTIENVTNAINLAILGGQFLWDNAFGPALQTLTDNGANFIDQYFGGLLNGIGKRDADARALIETQRQIIKSNYLTQMATFISGAKELFMAFLKEAKQVLISSIPVSFFYFFYLSFVNFPNLNHLIIIKIVHFLL